MSKEKLPMQIQGTIEKLSVADEDAADWVKTLVEAGFSNDEIDQLMSRMNQTYRNKMRAAEIEKEFTKIKEDLINRKGYVLTEEEAAKIKHGIASRYQN